MDGDYILKTRDFKPITGIGNYMKRNEFEDGTDSDKLLYRSIILIGANVAVGYLVFKGLEALIR